MLCSYVDWTCASWLNVPRANWQHSSYPEKIPRQRNFCNFFSSFFPALFLSSFVYSFIFLTYRTNLAICQLQFCPPLFFWFSPRFSVHSYRHPYFFFIHTFITRYTRMSHRQKSQRLITNSSAYFWRLNPFPGSEGEAQVRVPRAQEPRLWQGRADALRARGEDAALQ